jgi:very-short-patch-repair endonuclease
MKYRCECGNVSKIVFAHFIQGQRCKKCKNKTERIVLEFLEDEYTNVTSQVKFDWCKDKSFLPFDFLLGDLKIIIEVDGRQHFCQVQNWTSPEETQKRDIFKMKCVLEQGYKIIRIFQEDIHKKSLDWETLLKQTINKILMNNDNVIYLSNKKELYDIYKDKMIIHKKMI